MEQSLKIMAVHMYGVYIMPFAFASHPRQSVGQSRRPPNGTRVILRLQTHVGPTIGTLLGPASRVS